MPGAEFLSYNRGRLLSSAASSRSSSGVISGLLGLFVALVRLFVALVRLLWSSSVLAASISSSGRSSSLWSSSWSGFLSESS